MGAVAQRLDQGRISFDRTSDSTLVVHLSGPWHLQRDLPPISLLLSELGSRPSTRRLAYETAELTHWDSGLISFLTERGRDLSRTRYRGRPRRASGRSQAPARTGRGGAREKRRAQRGARASRSSSAWAT